MATLSAVALAALQQADSEGLTLLPADNLAGFKYVTLKRGRPEPFEAQLTRDGRQVSLGGFATAEEAALCVARTPEGRAAVEAAAASLERLPMTAEEAVAQAEAEGLTLLRADNASYMPLWGSIPPHSQISTISGCSVPQPNLLLTRLRPACAQHKPNLPICCSRV